MTQHVQTVIRMGAAHYDLTVTDASGSSKPFDLTKAKRYEKAEMARQLCEAYGITDPTPSPTKTRKAKHHGKHHRRDRPTGQLSGKAPIRPDETRDGAKKPSRRRGAPRPVPASGPTPN